jgi:aryl-alcohol dehydrogenase-like predicted oxidoreductase
MTEAPNMGGLSRKHIVQGCEASLKRLGIDTIDLYQIHRLDHRTPFEETLAALDHLVQSGKVRYLGASSMFAWQLMKSLSLSERHGWTRYVCMQDHYNLLYREEEREVLPLCLAEGLGVIPWSPLARGRLARPVDEPTARDTSDDYTRKLYDQPGDAEVIAANRAVASARGVSPAVTALAWLLSRPAVTAPIIGATKPEHLETAVRALDVQLTQEEIAAMEAPYRPHPVRGHS